MNNFLRLIVIVILPLQLNAQFWMDLGIKGGLGWNLLINKNIIDDPNIVYDLSFGHSIGGKIGLNFGETDAIAIDVMSSKFNQTFSYKTFLDSISVEDHVRTFNYNTLDLLILYRKYNEGTYVEIGPQISRLQKASGTDTNPLGFNNNIRDYFEDYYLSAALGFGGFLIGTENFGMTFGFRIKYGIKDLTNDFGREANYPNIQRYPNPSGSHPFIIETIIEFNQDFGYLAKYKCSQRKKFVLF